jgi:hypothetical protein
MRAPEHETLADAVGHLRDALALQSPPPAVQRALQAAFAAAPSQPLARRRASAAVVSGRDAVGAGAARWRAAAVCAALLMASTALLLLAAPTDPTRAQAAALAEPAFVPVAAAERWPPMAAGAQGAAPAWLVRAEMPRARLAEWGLPFDPARAGEAVRAELLMRPSGEVLAVRVLHASAQR